MRAIKDRLIDAAVFAFYLAAIFFLIRVFILQITGIKSILLGGVE